MYLCNDGHDEVCYETHKCPVCEKQQELDAMERKRDDVESELEAANDEIEDLKKQVEKLESDRD